MDSLQELQVELLTLLLKSREKSNVKDRFLETKIIQGIIKK